MTEMNEILKKWNLWWVEKKVSSKKVGIIRKELVENLNKLIKSREAIVIKGVRRSGKSTLLYQIIDNLINQKINPLNILYFNFDESIEYKDEKALDLVYNSFLELNNPKERQYIFFDEIQNIIHWEKWIKKNYDLYGDKIKFFLTGSNNTMLYDNLSKLLTGRILTKKIFPLSFKEFLEFNNLKLVDKDLQKNEIKHYLGLYFKKGGFPEAVLENEEEIYTIKLKEYFDSIILRDIIQPNNIREAAKLIELANYSITNISSEMSFNNTAKITGISINSLKEYLQYIENAFLIFQLRFFSYSLKESIMIQKPRKIYCVDSGLRNSVSFKFSEDLGKSAENVVFIELKRKNKEIYFWKGKKEVDFIVKNKDNTLTAINVTYGNKIDEREIESLKEFKMKYPRRTELILISENIEKKDLGINFIPLWKWLLDN